MGRDGTRARATARVLAGTCSWADKSLVDCGRFYPPNLKSAEELSARRGVPVRVFVAGQPAAEVADGR